MNKIIDIDISNIKSIVSAKNCLDKALKLNEFDDNAYSNLGWLLYALDSIDKAKHSFKKAIKLNPYKGSNYLNLVIINFQNSEEKLIENLSQVIYSQPDFIDSKLYSRIFELRPIVVTEAKRIAQNKLSKKKDNIILKAHLGKLLMDEKPKKAKILLESVIKELPNLSRPWLNLAIINKKLNIPKNIPKYYNNASFLSFNDYLVSYKYSEYLFQKNNAFSKKYYDRCLLEYKSISSQDFKKNIFTSDLKILNNLLIPSNLLILQKPIINKNQIKSYSRQ